ncbi:bZIP transcription factor [Sporobolomyces koalae]|uniref:bZIP transcription factor n=1 Tax=Sporobolomyces koalae TaxID=500713 RepID=UPI00317AAEB1
MSGLDWQAPDFLANQSGDDYLASLTSFLDASTTAKLFPNDQPHDLAVFDGGVGSLLATNGASPSSPELTSDASGASPASSDGTQSIPTGPHSNPASRRSTGGTSAAAQASQGAIPKPHDKRKSGSPASQQAIKDRRSSTGTNAAAYHSHPDGVDGDVARSASPEEEDGDGKKSGKKTSEKRKAQNRQAQRNFRERKEKHLKELEDKVGELEQRANNSEAENSALKQLLQQLKTENERLKVFESTFSFSYDKDVTNSATMPSSSTFQPPPPVIARPPLPTTSPSSSSNDSSNASFSFDNSSFDLPGSRSALPLAASSAGPSSSFPAAYPDFSTIASLPPTSSGSAFADNSFLSSLTMPPTPPVVTAGSEPPISPSAITNASSSASTCSSSAYVTTPPSDSAPQDLFATYRDPLADLALPHASLATLGDFDQLFQDTSADDVLLFEDSMKRFIKSPSPLVQSLPPASQSSTPLPKTPSDSNELLKSSLLHAERYEDMKRKYGLAGPNCPFGGLPDTVPFTFDLDNLCSELKAKATCQEAARQALKSAMAEDAQASRSAYPSQF